MSNRFEVAMDEFSFISYLADRVSGKVEKSGVIVGIGDDTAVIDVGLDDYLLFTCDCQIENIHYVSGKVLPFNLGRKLVSVNVSDICAMGGTPKWALVGLNIPANTESRFLKEFYDGLLAEAEMYNISIVGGNCSRTRKDVVFDMFLVGSVPKDQLVLRKGSQPGDLLVVTGFPGLAKAGLELLLGDEKHWPAAEEARKAIEKFSVPKARVDIGRIVAENRISNAMIDISDGLLRDALHLCEGNEIDLEIDVSKIPIHPICKKVAEMAGVDPIEWALTGGEDYELLFSVSPNNIFELKRKTANSGIPLTVIGCFKEGHGRVFLKRGNEKELISPDEDIGWAHF